MSADLIGVGPPIGLKDMSSTSIKIQTPSLSLIAPLPPKKINIPLIERKVPPLRDGKEQYGAVQESISRTQRLMVESKNRKAKDGSSQIRASNDMSVSARIFKSQLAKQQSLFWKKDQSVKENQSKKQK